MALAAFSLAAAVAWARPDFKAFSPLLIDLPGFQGEKTQGMTMDVGAGPMTTATRVYRRGSTQVTASVIIGEAAKGALTPLTMHMRMETAESHMLPANIGGFEALKNFTNATNSGSVFVELADDALFSLEYTGLGEDEAVALAQEFDLKSLQALATAK